MQRAPARRRRVLRVLRRSRRPRDEGLARAESGAKRARDAAQDDTGAQDRAIIRRRLEEAARKASQTIAAIAVLVLLGGLVVFALAREEADKALGLLAGLDPQMTVPEKINGVTHTVGELREKVAAEPVQALLVNLALAVVFAGLYRARGPSSSAPRRGARRRRGVIGPTARGLGRP